MAANTYFPDEYPWDGTIDDPAWESNRPFGCIRLPHLSNVNILGDNHIVFNTYGEPGAPLNFTDTLTYGQDQMVCSLPVSRQNVERKETNAFYPDYLKPSFVLAPISFHPKIVDLGQKYGIAEPSFGFENQTSTLGYPVSDYIGPNSIDVRVLDEPCTSEVETSPDPGGAAPFILTLSSSGDDSGTGRGQKVFEMKLQVNVDEISKYPVVYREDKPSGKAYINCCVRLSLLNPQGLAINYQETVINLEANLKESYVYSTKKSEAAVLHSAWSITAW